MAPSNLDLWDQYGHNLIPIMPFMDNVIVSAEGSYLIDADGNRILDLAAGQFCNILGHSHPEFTARLQEAMNKCLHTGSQFVVENVLLAAKNVAEIAPGALSNTIFLSTGTEANEFAVRVAKTYTNRNGLIGFDRGYYGISLATRSLSTISEGHIDFTPKVPDSYHIVTPTCARCPVNLEYPACEIACLDISQRLIGESMENVAAIIVETIVSAGGMIYPDADYFKAIRKLADDTGALLIVDEAQTGFGRCGTWFDCQNLGISPDILVFSKTSGNGYPSSGVVISDKIKEKLINKGFYHLSSHQNDPVTATAVTSVIDIIRTHAYLDQSKENGQYFIDSLQELSTRHPNIGSIRGRGLMIAFELVSADDGFTPLSDLLTPFVLACKKRGVHLTYTYFEGALRILPPINIERSDIDFSIEVFDKVLTDLKNGRLDSKDLAQKNKIIRQTEKQRRLSRVVNRLWETSPRYWVRKLRGS